MKTTERVELNIGVVSEGAYAFYLKTRQRHLNIDQALRDYFTKKETIIINNKILDNETRTCNTKC